MEPSKIFAALPAGFRQWGEENRALLLCVSNAARRQKRTMSDAEIWDVIAEAASSEWAEAREGLNAKDAALQEHMHPDNVPLGLIGLALDGGRMAELEREHSGALVTFTVINEHLYQQPELRALLQAAVHIQRTAEHSLYLSRSAMKLTTDFAAATREHAPQERKSGLAGKFSDMMRNMRQNASARHKNAPKPFQVK